jgi:hypothetical protein
LTAVASSIIEGVILQDEDNDKARSAWRNGPFLVYGRLLCTGGVDFIRKPWAMLTSRAV